MANNTFQLKRSLVSGNVPNASQLSQGELAINIPDHRLFTKDEANAVIDVFGQSVNTSANVQFRNGTYTGNLSVTGTTSFTGNVSSSNTITGTQIISTVVNGTAPFQVTSNTLVLNLNADFLDGQTGAYYSNLQNSTNILSLDKGGSNSNLVPVAGGLVYSNTQGLSITVAGTTGQYLISNGTSTPVWKSPADLAVGYAWTVNNGVYTTGSYSDPAWITSLAASKVGLGNVTNESKATMFASPTFTGTVTATGSVTIGGNLTVQGTQFIVSTNNASYTAGVLSLHKPATGWVTSNDGQDIGVVYENYDPAAYYQVISGGSANGSVATLQVPRGGAYFPGAWITITNAVPAEFNGSFKVTATTSNTFSFALASSNTINTTGQLGKSTRITEFTITSGTTGLGDKISTINYTTPNLALTVGQVITIYGCTPAEYNGTWTVLTATNGSFTFQNTQNAGNITVGGTVVIDNRRAFSGWSNDEKSFEFYKIGAQNPDGKFGGFYGTIKGSSFHSAHSPSITGTELQEGIAFYTADANDSSIWDTSTANNGTLGQIKTVSIGSFVVGATATNVHYTNASSLYIAGAPSNGNNVTIDNPYAIQVAGGKSLFGGNVQVYGVLTANDFLVQGNLTVQGTTTYINTQTLNVGDNIITLNADLGAVAPTENAGFEVNRGSSANVQFVWNETTDQWNIGNTAIAGTLDVSSTSTFAGLITGTITSANNADYLDGQHGAYYTNATNLSTGTVPAARLPQANATSNGAVLILDSVTNTAVAIYAAAPNSVKTAYDAAIAANTLANTKVSKAGDTVSGALVINNTLSVGNTSVTGFVNASAGVNSSVITVGTSFVANTTGVYHIGVVNAASYTVDTSFTANSTGAFPGSNSSGVSLGSVTNRWNLTANTGAFSGAVSITNTLAAGNTTITGFANVIGAAQVSGVLTANDVTISGNLTVSGTTTYLNTQQLNIGDNLIVLNADLGAVAPTENAGFEVNRGTSANVQFLWNETDDHWEIGNTHITGYLVANTGAYVNLGDGSLYVNTVSKYVGINTTSPTAPLTIGSSAINFTNPVLQFTGNANSYIQINGRNSNTGNNASADLMLIADNGTDVTNYIDIGINSSTYNQTAYGLMKPNSGYLFVNGGDLTLGTQTNHDILFHTGNTLSTSIKAGLYANGNMGVGNTTPADKLAVQGYIYASSGIKIGDDTLSSVSGIDATTYTGENFDLSGQEATPTGLAIDESTGTRFYVVGTTNKTIYQYTLTTGFNLATASYANKSFSVNTQDSAPQSLFIKPDGTKIYVSGEANDRVYEYNLGTAWDVSTATFVQFFSVAAQTGTPRGLSFSDDGTKMLVGGGSYVYRYNLSTAWNISTATFVDSLNVAAYETDVTSVDFDSSGSYLYIVGSRYNQFIQYNLSVAYSLASAAYGTRIDVSQMTGYDIHNIGEARGSLSGQYAYTLSTDKARLFEFSTISPAAQLNGSRFIVDADIHFRDHLVVYGTAKFADGIDSYGNTKLYTTRAGNTTIDGSFTVNAAALDITLNGSSTGNVIIGGTAQTGYIQLGRSSANQNLSIANGATASGSTKVVDIGTGGLAGSNTTINVGSASGTGSVVVNQLITVSNNINISGVANVSGNLNITGTINRSPVVTTTLTGDLTGSSSATLANLASNTITISTTLANTTVTPGTYGNSTYTPIITVDSKGRITNAQLVITQSTAVSDFVYTPANNTFKIVTGTGDWYASINAVNTFSVTSTLSVTGNATFDSGTLLVDSVNNRVGINNTTPTVALTVTGEASISANTTVGGKLSHTGLVPTTGTDIDQIYTVTDSLTLSTSWQDTSVNGAELSTGTYIVQVVVSDSAVGGGQISEYYSGIMSWYQLSPNSTVADEIALHRAGAGPSSGAIFLRVQRTVEVDAADLKLQIAGTTNNSGASNYVFKFRRMI